MTGQETVLALLKLITPSLGTAASLEKTSLYARPFHTIFYSKQSPLSPMAGTAPATLAFIKRPLKETYFACFNPQMCPLPSPLTKDFAFCVSKIVELQVNCCSFVVLFFKRYLFSPVPFFLVRGKVALFLKQNINASPLHLCIHLNPSLSCSHHHSVPL